MRPYLLDCTLRDGGYYTQWDFESQVVERYLAAMSRSKIDAVEVGFRNPPESGFKGRYAYAVPEHVSFPEKPDAKLGVMIDIKKFCLSKDLALDKDVLDRLFDPTYDFAAFVRLATTFDRIPQALEAAAALKKKGYQVFLNVMQASNLADDQLKDLVVEVSPQIDCFYIADSYGRLTPESTKRIFGILRDQTEIDLGLHAHDNMGLAVANAMAAIEAGASWIDGTLMGMGRGAGNARTEILATVLLEMGKKLKPEELASAVTMDFLPLHRKHNWGPSLAYSLAGLYSIHPTYVQRLMFGRRYRPDEIMQAVDALAHHPGRHSFNEKVFSDARAKANGWESHADEPALPNELMGSISDARVLVIGKGPTVDRHRSGVQVQGDSCGLVIATNDAPLIGNGPAFRTVIHRRHVPKVQASIEELGFNVPVVSPFSSGESRALFPLIQKLYNVPCRIGNIDVSGESIMIPSDVVGMYAIEIARIGGAAEVILAGFDGYYPGDHLNVGPAWETAELLNDEMNEYLKQVKSVVGEDWIKSITPTRYEIAMRNPYERPSYVR